MTTDNPFEEDAKVKAEMVVEELIRERESIGPRDWNETVVEKAHRVIEAYYNSSEYSGKSGKTVAATASYIALITEGEHYTMKEISDILNVSTPSVTKLHQEIKEGFGYPDDSGGFIPFEDY